MNQGKSYTPSQTILRIQYESLSVRTSRSTYKIVAAHEDGSGDSFVNHPNYLFTKVHWFDLDRHQRKALVDEINSLNGDRLLSTPVEDLCDYFEKKYRIEVPALKINDIVVDQQETQIDVSQDHQRLIRDRSQPFYMRGTAIEVVVPFNGDAGAFNIQPTTSTLSPPCAEVRDGSLTLRIEGIDLTADCVRATIDRSISEIEGYLANIRRDVQGFNDQVKSVARGAIEARRQKSLADRNLVGSLGFKIKEREGGHRTYAAPEVRRKIAPTLPPAGETPYKPEPALADVDYGHILNVIQNMAHVMERSPSAFVSMDEESLRSHFLVQLNGHYEGQATGETFNYQGKTDILIRSEGKNIFIAECKFWGGAKKLTETLDQLLSYSCWRDTKVAVIVFNRNKDFSKVLETIRETVKGHPNFKRDLGPQSPTNFRYVFSHKDDSNREMTLTVLAFDIPA